jgi:hypothetical protein
MKYTLFLGILSLASFCHAQKKESGKNQNIVVSFGKSKHYSGDIPGIMFSTEYSKNLKKRISLAIGLGSTIHDGAKELFFNDMNGNPVDGSIRYTVAGFQLSGHLGYNFLNSDSHQFLLRVGPVFRYQSSSLYDDLSIYYPAATGLPIPVIVFNNTEPQRTFTVGLSGQISYSYLLNDKIIIGALAGYQFDTYGDNISQLTLGVGYRF